MTGIEVVGLFFATAGFIKLVVDVGEKELENIDKITDHLSDFEAEI